MVKILKKKRNGDPSGVRTRVTAVKGRCPRPLDERDMSLNVDLAGLSADLFLFLKSTFMACSIDVPY